MQRSGRHQEKAGDTVQICGRNIRDNTDTENDHVKKGGTLMYSTCTVNDGENRRQIEAFTEKNSNFEIIYQKQFLPTQDVDGFYICKMLKKG